MDAKQTYTIEVVAEACDGPFIGQTLPKEGETLNIAAASLDEARKLAPVYMTVKARGAWSASSITALNCSATSRHGSCGKSPSGGA